MTQPGSPKDFLSRSEFLLNLARGTNWEDPPDEFNRDKIVKQIERNSPEPLFNTETPLLVNRDIKSAVNRYIESARVAANYASHSVQRFYFGKANQYKSAGIIRTPMRRVWWRNPWDYEFGRRLEVVDLQSLGDRNTQMLAVYSRLSMTWKHAGSDWEKAMKRSGPDDVRTPTFVIVDEAHNLIPAQTRSKAERAVKELFRRIIAEGRKYGLFLVVVTQRPDKLDPLILSECENKAIMKLGSDSVVALTRQMLGLEDLAPDLLKKCLEFESGRVLLAGSWCPDGPRICYVAARRTIEGGRSLQTGVWSVPREVMLLSLAPEAKEAAIALKRNYPTIIFVAGGGRRSIDDCANEMASAVVAATKINPEGPIPRQPVVIALKSPIILGIEGDLHHQVTRELCDWLDADTADITQKQLETWLANRITMMSPSERDEVSGHLTGMAFDILPPTQDPDAVESTIKSLPHLHEFLRQAHGEPVWHLHFRISQEES